MVRPKQTAMDNQPQKLNVGYQGTYQTTVWRFAVVDVDGMQRLSHLDRGQMSPDLPPSFTSPAFVLPNHRSSFLSLSF